MNLNFVCLIFCLIACLSVSLLVCLFFIGLFVCWSVCLSICLSVWLFVCLFVWRNFVDRSSTIIKLWKLLINLWDHSELCEAQKTFFSEYMRFAVHTELLVFLFFRELFTLYNLLNLFIHLGTVTLQAKDVKLFQARFIIVNILYLFLYFYLLKKNLRIFRSGIKNTLRGRSLVLATLNILQKVFIVTNSHSFLLKIFKGYLHLFRSHVPSQ